MATVTVRIPTNEEKTAAPVNRVECLPLASELTMVAADVAALSLPAIVLAILFGGWHPLWEFLLPIVATLPVFLLFRLYPGVGLHPVAELRRFCSATAAVAFAVLSITYKDPHSGRKIFAISLWVAGMMLAPLFRGFVRQALARKNWWGYPVFIVGDRNNAQAVLTRLQKTPELGLKPVALFDEFARNYSQVSGVPVIGSLDALEPMARAHGVHRVLIAITGGLQQHVVDLIESKATGISHILFVSDLASPSSLEIQTRDVSRMFAIEVRRNLLFPASRAIKRATDLFLTLSAGVLIAPTIALMCVLIKLDSPGPVFYGHARVGRGRQSFKVWKFRSMMVNGDALLQKHLLENPAAAEEWKRTRKLKDDPRITRLGRLLRKTSLDELPQLWNVLRGEMSLVGPRPVVEAEAVKYGTQFSHYLQVTPGLTGLWQVSGRNNTTYEERVELDTYYVRNWSPWLDLYLIARTFVVLISKEGAY